MQVGRGPSTSERIARDEREAQGPDPNPTDRAGCLERLAWVRAETRRQRNIKKAMAERLAAKGKAGMQGGWFAKKRTILRALRDEAHALQAKLTMFNEERAERARRDRATLDRAFRTVAGEMLAPEVITAIESEARMRLEACER